MRTTATEAYDYSHLIGHQLTVGYGDHNDAFAGYLPRSGTVVRQVSLEDGTSDWLVLQLDESFEYQFGSLDTGFRAAVITHFLIRSRVSDCSIGSGTTWVFLLLDPNQILETKERFCSTDFIHVCWAIVSPGGGAPS